MINGGVEIWFGSWSIVIAVGEGFQGTEKQQDKTEGVQVYKTFGGIQ